jgi:hypothetical protein
LLVTFEAGTSAAWLYDLLRSRVAKVLVCDPRIIGRGISQRLSELERFGPSVDSDCESRFSRQLPILQVLNTVIDYFHLGVQTANLFNSRVAYGQGVCFENVVAHNMKELAQALVPA